MTALDRLEKWKCKHKARQFTMGMDDGFGACCFDVELWGENEKYVYCADVPTEKFADPLSYEETINKALDKWEQRYPEKSDANNNKV